MTTYTVYRPDYDYSSMIEGSGLSLASAAHVLLTGDGYAYEIRDDATPARDGDVLRVLWVSDGSANSPRSARYLHATRIIGWSDDEIFTKVVKEEWHGFEAMTDDEFAAYLTASNEED